MFRITPTALALALIACGPGESAEGEAPPASSAPAAQPAPVLRAEIVLPGEGAEVSGEVPIMLSAQGVIVEAASGTRDPGRGHHHLFVDTDLSLAGEPIPAGVPGIIHIGTGASEYVLTDLTPGEHRIIAVLAHGDHVPMEGVATDTLNIVVRP